ncbi:MAG: hypothetical protein WBB67_06490 [bacterium]
MRQFIEGIILIVLGIALVVLRDYYIYFCILFIAFGALKLVLALTRKKR